MSDLRTYCSACRAEIPVSQRGRDGLCPICLISEIVEPLRIEYKRLWAKRMRYLAAGVKVHNCERQLATVARRLGDKVHQRIGVPEQAIAIINAHLEDARNQVERGTSRIHIARPGDLAQRLSA